MKRNEISHFFHPKHNLKFECSEVPFKCDGCKEVRIGSRYKCATTATTSSCDFDLHTHCALPASTIFHPFYPNCVFKFFSRSSGDILRYCNACRKVIMGFNYHCTSCGFDLHPCCAKLPMVLPDGDVKLYLSSELSSFCHKCGLKGRSWGYRSSCKKYNLHVACVREMLVENWHEIYFGHGSYGSKSGSYIGNGRDMMGINKIPGLKNTLQNYHGKNNGGSKSKVVMKCCEMAGSAIQFVISALLGDPTTLIAGVIGSLMSRG